MELEAERIARVRRDGETYFKNKASDTCATCSRPLTSRSVLGADWKLRHMAALFALVLACCSCGASPRDLDDGPSPEYSGDARTDVAHDVVDAGADVSCLLPDGTELVRPCPDGSGPACACQPFGQRYGACVPAVCS